MFKLAGGRMVLLIVGALALSALGIAAFVLLILPDGGDRAEAASGGPEMALTVPNGAPSCAGGSCDVPIGGSFTLAVQVVTRPVAGYVLFQSYVDFGDFDPAASEDGAGPNTCNDGIDNGGDDEVDRFDNDCVTVHLAYTPATASDEIVWPDLDTATALRGLDGPGLVLHGGITSVIPPLPTSTFEGTVVELDMACPPSEVSQAVQLLPLDDPIALYKGALFVEPDQTHVTPKVGSLTINCLELGSPTPTSTVTDTPTPTPTATITPTPTPTPPKLPEPGDTDGDGCSDQRENGPDEKLGGLRDYLNPYDFYDVAGADGGPPDRFVDLANDILGVIQHYAPQGQPPYDIRYDRGPAEGPYPWSLSPPDGVIDLPNDVLGVILQFFHDCR